MDFGKFFGGLFGRKKDEDERKPVATVKRPAPTLTLTQAPNQTVRQMTSLTMPAPLVIQDEQPEAPTIAPINIGGVQQTPRPDEPLVLVDKPQQGIRLLGKDEQVKPSTRPNVDPNAFKASELLPSLGRGFAKGTADLLDLGVEVGATAVDNEFLKRGIGKQFGHDWAPNLKDKTKGISDTLRGFSEGVEVEQIKKVGANPVNNMTYSVGQFLDPAIITGTAARLLKGAGKTDNVANTVKTTVDDSMRSADELAPVKTADAARSTADDVVIEEPKVQGITKSNEPITQVEAPAKPKPEAITSANPDYVPPTVRQPSINIPQEVTNNAPPMIQAPVIPEAKPLIDAPVVRTPDEAVADVQAQIDEAATRPAEMPAPSQIVDVESPNAARSQEIAEAQVPVVPVSEAQLAREAAQQAPTEAIAQNVPSIKAYGKTIELNEKNGYKAVPTPDGGAIYEKLARVGSNRKGDRGFERRVYDAQGNKLTPAQADAMVSGELRSRPIEYPSMPVANATPTDAIEMTLRDLVSYEGAPDLARVDEYRQMIRNGEQIDPIIAMRDSTGKLGIEDGKHRFQAATEEGLETIPTIIRGDNPVPAFDGELGSIAQRTVQSGRQMDDAGWEGLSQEVGAVANQQAEAVGTDIPTILEKVQRAYDNRKAVKTAQDAGLSEQEFKIYKDLTNELTYLRNRADPSLLGPGNVDRWYAPRQTPDTEYDPSLVNEISRGSDGLRTKDLDLTTVPIEQAIRRYGNAQKAISDDVINQVETVKVTENGTTRVIDSGLQVPDDVKASFDNRTKEYVAKTDEVERLLAETDVAPKDIDRLIDEAHSEMDDAFSELIAAIPKNTQEGREAIARLQERRGAYIQSTIRTNMFSNIVNRALDHVGSNVVRATNQMAGIADSIASVATGRRVLSTGGTARGIAKDYAKGALKNNLMRDARTSVAMSGDSMLAKGDAMFRAAGTLITGSSDLTTTAVKMTNRIMLGRAQAQGITSKAGMEEYLRKNINSPEYKELLTGINDVYNGYLGLPTSLTSRMGNNGRWISNVDNLVNKGLERFAPVLPPRARRELNDLIMPAMSGFAGATYRIGKKALNSAAVGVPGVYKGVKLMREGGEASRDIGQMVMIRSMIDGLVGGTAAGATVGAMMADQMEWTGAYPDDPNEAALWERQGIVPNSLSFKTGQIDEDGNEVRVQIQPGRVLGPFSLPVVLPAVMKSGGNPQDVFDATLGQMLENMGAEGVLRNAGNISTALTGSGYTREKAINNLMSSAGFSVSNVVPLAGAQNNVANALDDVKRDQSGNRFLDSIKNRNPFTRETLPEKVDNLGDPVRNNTLLGSQAITTAEKPATTELAEAGVASFDSEIDRLTSAGFKDVMPGKDIKNASSKDDATALLGTDLYKNADDTTKADYLKKAFSATTFKDINTKLDPAMRSTLMEHKLQTEDQRKVWLEDNTKAASYFEAKYKNKEVSGTLSADDKDMNKTGSLAQHVAAAKVDRDNNIPQELTQVFKSTNKTEFKNMNAEAQAALYAYDEARVKAGLPAKFGTKTTSGYQRSGGGKGGSGGGRGGSGSDKFSFAQLPGSLVGNQTASKGYAEDAPTFKPIADLRAPSRGGIPKGRTISVKKGFQI